MRNKNRDSNDVFIDESFPDYSPIEEKKAIPMVTDTDDSDDGDDMFPWYGAQPKDVIESKVNFSVSINGKHYFREDNKWQVGVPTGPTTLFGKRDLNEEELKQITRVIDGVKPEELQGPKNPLYSSLVGKGAIGCTGVNYPKLNMDGGLPMNLVPTGPVGYVGTGVPYYPPLATPEQEQRIKDIGKAVASLQSVKYPPIATPEQEAILKNMGNQVNDYMNGEGLHNGYDKNDHDWIQTYSGRRFTPLSPNYKAIVIQDIAHALSMQCRFSGHCKEFYSVAQHSVLVSYICNFEDALWGLLHDASEAYLVDVPRPLKKSGKFGAYVEFETVMQAAICKRFNLPLSEPESVKKADKILLVTEARELMAPAHSTWNNPAKPIPFKIEPWNHHKAKNMFMSRFLELTGKSV